MKSGIAKRQLSVKWQFFKLSTGRKGRRVLRLLNCPLTNLYKFHNNWYLSGRWFLAKKYVYQTEFKKYLWKFYSGSYAVLCVCQCSIARHQFVNKFHNNRLLSGRWYLQKTMCIKLNLWNIYETFTVAPVLSCVCMSVRSGPQSVNECLKTCQWDEIKMCPKHMEEA